MRVGWILMPRFAMASGMARRELYVAAHECGPILASTRVALLQQAVACADIEGGHEIACHCGSHDLERRVDERVEILRGEECEQQLWSNHVLFER